MENKIVTINLEGGIIALFQSPQAQIQRVLVQESVNGWKVKFVLPPNPNPLFIFVQIFFGVFTCFIYFPLPAYIVLLEKD